MRTAFDAFFSQSTFDHVQGCNLAIQHQAFRPLNDGGTKESHLRRDQVQFEGLANGEGCGTPLLFQPVAGRHKTGRRPGMAAPASRWHNGDVDPAALIEMLYRGKTRKSGEPAATHFYAVRDLLAAAGVEQKTILTAALLHDVLEDTALSEEYLRLRFGRRTAAVVRLLSKQRLWHTAYAKAKSNIDEMGNVWHEYPEVILIKLADRLHNVQTIRGFRPAKRREYLAETSTLLVPFFEQVLARHRLEDLHTPGARLLARLNDEVARQRRALLRSAS